MKNPSALANQQFCKLLSRIAAVFAIVIGSVVLVGWVFDIAVLKSVVPEFSSMNPMTAICFMLLGVALLIHLSSYNTLRNSIATACALLVLLVAVSRLGAIFLGFNFNPDQMLFTAKLGTNHIAPNTAFNFFLLSAALLSLRYPKNLIRHSFIILAMMVSFMALVGYAYDVHALYKMPAFISMALNTAFTFFILSCGMLCFEPDYGFVRILTNDGISGIMSRELLPRCIIALVGLGWLRLFGQRHGFYDPEIGVLVFLFSVIVVFIALIWQNALVLEDIDKERQEKDKKLQESEQRFNLATQSAKIGVWDLDLVNDRAVRSLRHDQIFGYSTLQPEWGAKIFFNHILPADQDIANKSFTEASATGHFKLECRIIWPDKSIHWIAAEGHVYRNEKGDPVSMLGVVMDITESKRAKDEIQNKTEELERSNNELEQFAYVASHDLQEPLRMVVSFTQKLEQKYKDKLDTQAKQYIDFAVDGAKRMQILIDDLLSFSKVGQKDAPRTKVDLNGICQHILEDMKMTITDNQAVVEWEALPVLHANETQMSQLFLNLISNGIKYHSQRSPVIRITSREIARHRWQFSVSDNGIGIDEKHFGKLFVIFQRLHTKKEYKGTGIGLALCKKIVENYDGRIWLESKIGKGTIFYFTLNEGENT